MSKVRAGGISYWADKAEKIFHKIFKKFTKKSKKQVILNL